MIDVLVEETTTLPEGAQLSVCRCKLVGAKRSNIFTELRAQRDGKLVKMRVTDVGPSNLSTYLTLIRRELLRRRLQLTKKPELEPLRRPTNLDEFVQNMAYHDMFIFTALE